MIHILTFHNALNYGAILQCYALYTTINRFENCDVLDYDISVSPKKNIKGFIKSVLVARRQKIKRQKFNDFIKKHIILTRKFNNYEELCGNTFGEHDGFCVGSDQVWNWDLVGEDEAYRLSFVSNDKRKFSYAASIGRTLDFGHIEILKNRLNGFSGVSVRETSATDILRQHGVCCVQNIDPVFLLKNEEWKNVGVPVKNEKTPFVLVYLLRKAPNLLKSAEEYARKNKLRIVFISTGLKRDIVAEYVVKCGPDEFVRYFSKAEAVFTNSFHGISFSILFNKPFFFEFLQEGADTNSRIKDITEMFHVQRQNIAFNKMLEFDADYNNINNIIQQKREESLSYLKACINEGGLNKTWREFEK